ncbi:MAG: hypothetical protein B7Z33_13955 [Sphingomonadales bacterium 12-68-11]|nr:MAG: hypothetical protein B7Z33_13955 [Sphingomonadales bacterium 12-68-11]OYX17099.1 MAG: hypothetical protein B7Z07_00940 [Sphingomonadales bacterium 32-67-7]
MAADSARPKRRDRRARRALAQAKAGIGKIPGPSPNPATNLLILDVAMRGASFLAARAVERAVLKSRYDADKAADIVKGRSLLQSVVATGAGRIASRSVPGLLIVAGGLLAKAAFDRSLGPRRARRAGEKQLAQQAAEADE